MISTIFTNFFNCLSLPTVILNNTFSTVFTYKYDSNIESSFYLSQAIAIIKKSNYNPGAFTINIQKNITYSCIMFYHYDNLPMYILIGPYTLIKDDSIFMKNNISYISESSINDTIKLHSYIIDTIKNKCIQEQHSPCVNHAIEYIKHNYTQDISIDDICNELNINKCYFCSIFKKETGLTFINYLNSYKIEKSKELLKNTNLSLLDIALSVGFNNQSYYSTVFKKITCKTPLEFREEIPP